MQQQLSLFGPEAWPATQEPRPASRLPESPRVERGPERRVADVLSRTRRLQDLVALAAGVPVRLVITDNRHTLLSWRPQVDRDAGYVVRAHHMFLDAPEDVAQALGRYVALPARRRDGQVLDDFMAARRHLVTRDRRPLAAARGSFHDLERIYGRLNAAEFDNLVSARIGWGEPGSPRRRSRRSIQLGCYDPESGTIVIHPALDQAFVPEFFVTSVVFHEMLHQVIPATTVAGRRVIHSAVFTRREEAFPLTDPARRWEKAHVDQLLAYRGNPPGLAQPRAARRIRSGRR